MIRFEESLYSEWIKKGYAQSFEITEIIFHAQTAYQNVLIFRNKAHGKVLALDGIIQTTEADEFIYHEMLTHVPLLARGDVKDVLIIGGGDGGILREVLQHPVDSATMVEIDREVVDLCREYMPSLSADAFDDPRTDLIIGDGLAFVAETDCKFDAIIVDSTDPVGPGEVLFTEKFYRDCHGCLRPGGILATQNGVPFHQPEEVTQTHQRMGAVFADTAFYVAAVPTYVGGVMTLAWGCDDAGAKSRSLDTLKERYRAAGLKTRYYTPELHVASFALPAYIQDLLG
ncbi:MAG: polyamine aminopropyltransferase [Magnetospiraceae bacterium]